MENPFQNPDSTEIELLQYMLDDYKEYHKQGSVYYQSRFNTGFCNYLNIIQGDRYIMSPVAWFARKLHSLVHAHVLITEKGNPDIYIGNHSMIQELCYVYWLMPACDFNTIDDVLPRIKLLEAALKIAKEKEASK